MGEEMSFETQTLVTLAEIKTLLKDLVDDKIDHEARLRKLEHQRSILLGVALVVSPALGAIVGNVMGAM